MLSRMRAGGQARKGVADAAVGLGRGRCIDSTDRTVLTAVRLWVDAGARPGILLCVSRQSTFHDQTTAAGAQKTLLCKGFSVERVAEIEPAWPAWKASWTDS